MHLKQRQTEVCRTSKFVSLSDIQVGPTIVWAKKKSRTPRRPRSEGFTISRNSKGCSQPVQSLSWSGHYPRIEKKSWLRERRSVEISPAPQTSSYWRAGLSYRRLFRCSQVLRLFAFDLFLPRVPPQLKKNCLIPNSRLRKATAYGRASTLT